MLSRYALIGKQLTMIKGKVTVLGGLLYVFTFFGWSALLLTFASEFHLLADWALWQIGLMILAATWITTRLIARVLFHPMPPAPTPRSTPNTVEPGILLRMLASRRYQTLGRLTPGQPLAPVIFEGVHHEFD
ncbi:hypothetical protein SCOR_09980 [Sulfidibacter corallicola]|uniref:Uncharacterized protein n=1 Tax=Sulfidibacter corallicola TaxID=2818388 RepID=A0A8A4TLQ4_SULCO|nr:hypothetical protein [Sulfidibacter corallicola]QTD50919.1 hypothetical protein J3U87_00490 [Sulfidibacter corallicola]